MYICRLIWWEPGFFQIATRFLFCGIYSIWWSHGLKDPQRVTDAFLARIFESWAQTIEVQRLVGLLVWFFLRPCQFGATMTTMMGTSSSTLRCLRHRMRWMRGTLGICFDSNDVCIAQATVLSLLEPHHGPEEDIGLWAHLCTCSRPDVDLLVSYFFLVLFQVWKKPCTSLAPSCQWWQTARLLKIFMLVVLFKISVLSGFPCAFLRQWGRSSNSGPEHDVWVHRLQGPGEALVRHLHD